MFTLSQARNSAAILAASRMAADDPALVRLIDRAVDLLMVKGDWEGTTQEYCFYTCGGCIYVPEEITGIRGVQINGRPARRFTRPFDYLATSPGRYGAKGDALTDRGVRQILTQPACCTGLMAVTTRPENDDAYVEVIARDASGHPITERRDDGVLYQSLRRYFYGEQFAVFDEPIRYVDAVVKTSTQGVVSLHEYNAQYHDVGNLIAQVLPFQTSPEYRQYEVSTLEAGQEADVYVLAKRKHVPLYDDAQALAITQAEAIGYAIRHLLALDDEDLRGSEYYLAKAKELLGEQVQDVEDGAEVRMNFDKRITLGGARRL